MSQQSTYELIGGAATIRQLVEAFYPKVQKNAEIGPFFPKDITPVMEKQYLFLTQFFGGPPLYTEQYGHPMMRARHMPFAITESRAKAWLSCMKEALEEIDLPEGTRAFILDRLSGPAYHFINTRDDEQE